MPNTEKISGKCLCGQVEFTSTPTSTDIDVCHCSTCRQWTGGPFIAMVLDGVTFQNQTGLVWYDSSEWAKRGFCNACGTTLFYQLKHEPDTYHAVTGGLTVPAEAKITKHIFIDHKPDFYDFADDAPRHTQAEFMKLMGISE